MGAARPELFPQPQGDLFGGVAEAPRRVYVPPRELILKGLAEQLDMLTGAETWPWDKVRLDLNRNHVWPHLLRHLPEADAAEWRARLEAEAARLDGADAGMTAA